MRKLFDYFKQIILSPYKPKDIALISLIVLLITVVILTINALKKDETNKKSFAKKNSNSLEPENGTSSGNVSAVNDQYASADIISKAKITGQWC